MVTYDGWLCVFYHQQLVNMRLVARVVLVTLLSGCDGVIVALDMRQLRTFAEGCRRAASRLGAESRSQRPHAQATLCTRPTLEALTTRWRHAHVLDPRPPLLSVECSALSPATDQ